MTGRYYVLYIHRDSLTQRELYWTGEYIYEKAGGRERCHVTDDRAGAKRFQEAKDAYDRANAEIAKGHKDLQRFRVGLRVIRGFVNGTDLEAA